MDKAGAPRGRVEGLERAARAAGLDVAEANGNFRTLDPGLGFELHAASLAAVRERAAQSGFAAEKIDDLLLNLRAAKTGHYQWVSSPFYLDLALRKPAVT